MHVAPPPRVPGRRGAATRLAPLALGLLVLRPGPLRADPPDDDAVKAEALEHVRAAVTAFEGQRWAEALEHFEAARELRYAAKLDFNIAVLHEKLLAETADPTARSFHAARAIAAYKGYLAARPDAADGDDVRARIDALNRPEPVIHGEPESRALAKDGDAQATTPPEGPYESPEDDTTSDDASVPATTAADAPDTWDAVGFVHFTPMLGVAPQLLDADGAEAGGTLMLELSGGATLGRRDLVSLGGALGGVFGGAARQDTLAFGSFHFGAVAGLRGIVTRKDRLLLEAQFLAALSRQSLRARNDAVPVGCTDPGQTNALVGARLGFRGGVRLGLGVLLGRRRRHAITFSIYPAVGAYGGPTTGAAACDENADPFVAAGIDESVTVDVWSGLGYQFRI